MSDSTPYLALQRLKLILKVNPLMVNEQDSAGMGGRSCRTIDRQLPSRVGSCAGSSGSPEV